MLDASHGNNDEWTDDWEVREAFRSLGGKCIFISNMEAISGTLLRLHLLSFGSQLVKRIVNSTMKADTYQMTEVQDAADTLRAAFCHLHVPELQFHNWETRAAQFMVSVWFTDCKSLHDTLQRPIAKTVEKRLGIDLAGLRQYLWRRVGEEAPEPRTLEAMPPQGQRTDYLRWIDTVVMCCDVLTKRMKEDALVQVIVDNEWNIEQPAEALAIKRKKQAQRRAPKPDIVEDGVPEELE